MYARETVLLDEYPPFVETMVKARRESASWASQTSPCETFVETGLAIKAESPLKPTFTIELPPTAPCGYLPTAEHHKLGGYETWRTNQLFGSRRRSQDSRQNTGTSRASEELSER